jgi:hypothetical protein
MKNAILMAVQEKGALLFMTDGTAWKINPDSIEIASAWQPPCLIEIDEKSNNRNYDYTLTNLDTNKSVTALRHK